MAEGSVYACEKGTTPDGCAYLCGKRLWSCVTDCSFITAKSASRKKRPPPMPCAVCWLRALARFTGPIQQRTFSPHLDESFFTAH